MKTPTHFICNLISSLQQAEARTLNYHAISALSFKHKIAPQVEKIQRTQHLEKESIQSQIAAFCGQDAVLVLCKCFISHAFPQRSPVEE